MATAYHMVKLKGGGYGFVGADMVVKERGMSRSLTPVSTGHSLTGDMAEGQVGVGRGVYVLHAEFEETWE